MVNKIVNEINKCLDNNCYMAALSLALMLPDICGKAKFPEVKENKNVKERYCLWYEEYVEKYEKNPNVSDEMPYLSKEVVYSLRCSVLHSGNPNIDLKIGIPHFELIWNKRRNEYIMMDSASVCQILENGKNKTTEKTYSLDIRRLCFILSSTAKNYYNENKEKFQFFNYNIKVVR